MMLNIDKYFSLSPSLNLAPSKEKVEFQRKSAAPSLLCTKYLATFVIS